MKPLYVMGVDVVLPKIVFPFISASAQRCQKNTLLSLHGQKLRLELGLCLQKLKQIQWQQVFKMFMPLIQIAIFIRNQRKEKHNLCSVIFVDGSLQVNYYIIILRKM